MVNPKWPRCERCKDLIEPGKTCDCEPDPSVATDYSKRWDRTVTEMHQLFIEMAERIRVLEARADEGSKYDALMDGLRKLVEEP